MEGNGIGTTTPSIVLVGQPRWSNALGDGLRRAGLRVAVVGFGTLRDAFSASSWTTIRRADLIVRVGFRPGAKTWRGLLFDVALQLAIRRTTVTCCYWIGTDVMHHAAERETAGRRLSWRSPERCIDHNMAGSQPLQKELRSCGLDTTLMEFPWETMQAPRRLPPFPEVFTVLTYVPDARSDFYGGHVILEAAKRLPEVSFVVMGGMGTWATNPPPNVDFAGWVTDPSELFANASCVLRIPRHDSIGGTAVEGLLYGRPVLYTEDLRFTKRVARNAESIVSAISALQQQSLSGSFSPNSLAAEWARYEFDPVRRFSKLAEFLSAVTD